MKLRFLYAFLIVQVIHNNLVLSENNCYRKMEDAKIRQRSMIKFFTLEGDAPEQILEHLQKVYREDALSLDQVEYWAMETNDERRRETKLAINALVRNTDVMADVLAFLPRKVIANQLAHVNRQFSALCNCWCQPDEADAAVPSSSTLENWLQRKGKWNQGLKG